MLPSTELRDENEDAMRAIVYREYGPPDVPELQEIDQPVVRDDEVLAWVHAASARSGDWHHMRGLPYILRLMGYGAAQAKEHCCGTRPGRTG
jgi:NADPH:quinone reductase-like Zn-dependent oxidoreductase